MASSMSNAAAVLLYADFYNKINAFAFTAAYHDSNIQSIVNTLAADVKTALTTIATDGGYTINWSEPRYTIVTPYAGVTRPLKVKSGQSISLTMATSGGELNSAPVWSLINAPSWLTINSGTGALAGTAPALTNTTFNVITGGSSANLYDSLRPVMLNCINAFGKAVNGPLSLNLRVCHSSTLDITSAGTGSGVHAGALATYTAVAAGATSFVAYGLEQLNAGTGGTVAINPATGAISGNCGSATIAGPVTIYVAAINAYGEGPDKAVVITLS